MPDDGEHVFEFAPELVSNTSAFSGSETSLVYVPRFIDMDGSGATLTFLAESFNHYELTYDALDNEYVTTFIAGLDGGPGVGPPNLDYFYGNITDGFNPSDVMFGPTGTDYQLTTKDGTSYLIDATSGQIQSNTTASGTTTAYDYSHLDSNRTGTVTATTNGQNVLSITMTQGRITEIQGAPGQNSIFYNYTGNNLLTSVQDQTGNTTLYSYQNPSQGDLLTGVTNALGQVVLQAQYNTIGELQSLTNSHGVTLPISFAALGSNQAGQVVTDALGNVTENVYDETYGTILRRIQTVTDSSGNVLDYIVTVNNYSYVTDTAGQMSSLRPSGEQVLQTVQQYAPFEIQGIDAQGARFTQAPVPDDLVSQTIFDTENSNSDPASGQIISSSTQIASPTDVLGVQMMKTTLNQNYSVVDSTTGKVEPGLVTVETQIPDNNALTGWDNAVQSQTYYRYDTLGRLISSVTPVARVTKNGTAETTIGTYSDVSEGDLPAFFYMSLSGFSQPVNDPVVQKLTWTPVDFAYEWSSNTGDDNITIMLQDNSLMTRGSGKVQGGDNWTLSVNDPQVPGGPGINFQDAKLQFNISVAGFSQLLNQVLTIDHPGTGLNIAAVGWLAEGTYNYYNSSGVTSSYSATTTIAPDGTYSTPSQPSQLTQTDYYSSNSVGAVAGAVQDTYDASRQETYYAYDTSGRTVLAFTHKAWTAYNGTADVPYSGWVGTINQYDPTTGRLTDTYSATYLDNPTPGADNTKLPVILGTLPGPSVVVDTTKDSLYSFYVDSANQSVSSYVPTAHYDYNSIGQKIDSIDQYLGKTTYTYDANGNLIQTLYPDSTETLTVYDPLNRAIWTTNKFLPSQPNSVVATFTDYNQLGQVRETDQYQGTAISITMQQVGSTAFAETVLSSQGTLISATKTYYDSAGLVIETISSNAITGSGATATINSTGLRTGTIYYPDGQVEYTGPLSTGAPDGGHSGSTTGDYLPSDFASTTLTESDLYNSSLGMFYTHTVDQNSHPTDTYTDAKGRTVRVVNSDGSFTETLYSIVGQDVTTDQEGDILAQPQGIVTGGSETVSIAQRKPGDAPIATYSFYDATGKLTDVYEPSVIDGNPADTSTYGTMVIPRWTYVYDASGNETAQVSPNEQAGYQASPNTFTGDTRFAYDQNGNEVSRTLPDGEKETFTYDQFNRVATHTDFDGNVAQYSYYTDYNTTSDHYTGSLASVQYTGSAGHQSETVTYTYTSLGQLYQLTDASGTTPTTYTYDVFGNETQAVTPEGTINYYFDPATQLHTETWTEASGSSTNKANAVTDILYGYDQFGRLASVSQSKINGATPPAVSGGTLYNAGGVPSTTTLPTTLYTYDANGNLLTESDPNGNTTTYAYDSLNRLTGETVTNSSSITIFSQNYTLYDNGQRASVEEKEFTSTGTLTSDTTTLWAYDNEGRLTQVTMLTGSVTAPFTITLAAYGGQTLTWDGSGAFVTAGATEAGITGMTQAGAALISPWESKPLGGSGADWMLWISTGSGGTENNATFSLGNSTFNPDGAVSNTGTLIPSNPPAFSIPANVTAEDLYAYDLNNNRMQDIHTGTLGGPAGTTTYAYNGDDQNTSSTLTIGTTPTVTNNTYDFNGSLVQSVTGAQTTTYTYDARNKMVGYAVNGTTDATYVYDDAGNRVQETVNGTTTTYYLTDSQNPTGYGATDRAAALPPAARRR